MISFFTFDYIVIILFFIVLISIAVYFYFRKVERPDEYFLNGRSVGLILFILTNVSTWYGGILGIGEFSYNYGILSWVTQGLPYYIFSIIFAFIFAKKIRASGLYTIPEAIEANYGNKTAFIASILIYFLTSPAPYLLMIGQLISIVFGVSTIYGIVIGVVLSIVYLYFGGYKSDIWSDVFMFFVMYAGFIALLLTAYINLGGIDFLIDNLPANHLSFTGGANFVYILIWFFIALWTFADPGFHQRCYSAKTPKVAFWGILISVPLWFLFDFLTTGSGLYAKATLTNLPNPLLAFPLLANKILPSGLKGLFFIGLFATVFSTLNSFLFISAQTFGKDIFKGSKYDSEKANDLASVKKTRVGLIITSLISIILAISINSIIEMWYLIGSVAIPGLIILIFGTYFPILRVKTAFAIAELIAASSSSLIFIVIKKMNILPTIHFMEPMIIGLSFAVIIHIIGMMFNNYKRDYKYN